MLAFETVLSNMPSERFISTTGGLDVVEWVSRKNSFVGAN